jgi:hypothetical protein
MTSRSPRGGKTRSAGGNIKDLAGLGRATSRKLVFDSGLVSMDDPRIVAMHEGYDDLVKLFDRPVLIY